MAALFAAATAGVLMVGKARADNYSVQSTGNVNWSGATWLDLTTGTTTTTPPPATIPSVYLGNGGASNTTVT